MSPLMFIIGIVIVIIIVIVLVVVGLRSPTEADALQTHLAEYSTRENLVTLEEIELSQPFSERFLLPIVRRLGEFAMSFTPEASLKSVQHQLDLAGNPKGILFMDATTFWSMRLITSVGFGGLILFADSSLPIMSKKIPIMYLGFVLGGAILGFFIPVMLLKRKIKRRQGEIIKYMPDALDLLAIYVEGGFGLTTR